MLSILHDELRKGAGACRADIQFTDGEELEHIILHGADELGLAFVSPNEKGTFLFVPWTALATLTILDSRKL